MYLGDEEPSVLDPIFATMAMVRGLAMRVGKGGQGRTFRGVGVSQIAIL